MQQPWDDVDARDDASEIRYSLTALGEAALDEFAVDGPRFRGFEPCVTPLDQNTSRSGIAHRGGRP